MHGDTRKGVRSDAHARFRKQGLARKALAGTKALADESTRRDLDAQGKPPLARSDARRAPRFPAAAIEARPPVRVHRPASAASLTNGKGCAKPA